MALQIPFSQPPDVRSRTVLADTPTKTQPDGLQPQAEEPEMLTRDRQGVRALSLVAEGETALQTMLEEMAGKRQLSGQEATLYRKAEEEIERIAGKTTHSETNRAVKNQLQASLHAFAIRSKDLALREHLDNCQKQLEQRKKNVTTLAASLVDTIQHTPDPDLKRQAKKALSEQLTAYSQAEKALQLAMGKFLPSTAAGLTSSLPHPSGLEQQQAESAQEDV